MDPGAPKITLDQESFKALASDVRIGILKRLDVRRETVTDLSNLLELSKPTLLEHLEKLQTAGLVKRIDEGRKWIYYELSDKGRKILHPERVAITLALSAAVVLALIGALYVILSASALLESYGTFRNETATPAASQTADARDGRLRGRRSGGLIAERSVGLQQGRRGQDDVQRADQGEDDRGGQGQCDGDPLRMQDLAALVRQLVVDPLAALVDALHQARRLQLLEVLEECRLAQFEEVAQVRDGLAPHVKAFEDADAHVRGERLEALLVEGDLGRAGIHPAVPSPPDLFKECPRFGRTLTVRATQSEEGQRVRWMSTT